jgi:hypothetical protein
MAVILGDLKCGDHKRLGGVQRQHRANSASANVRNVKVDHMLGYVTTQEVVDAAAATDGLAHRLDARISAVRP